MFFAWTSSSGQEHDVGECGIASPERQFFKWYVLIRCNGCILEILEARERL